jgi:hypothetical protein
MSPFTYELKYLDLERKCNFFFAVSLFNHLGGVGGGVIKKPHRRLESQRKSFRN